MTHELGITSLAEGVETAGEHAICVDLGFELGQGFFYGKPDTAQGNVAMNEIPTDVLLV